VYWPHDWLSNTPFIPDILWIREPPVMYHQLVTFVQIHWVLHHNDNKVTITNTAKYYYIYYM